LFKLLISYFLSLRLRKMMDGFKADDITRTMVNLCMERNAIA